MLKFKQKGDFSNLDKFFKKSIKVTKVNLKENWLCLTFHIVCSHKGY